MLRFRDRRRKTTGAQAVSRLLTIEESIAALPDEDLLDLADIFRHQTGTPLFNLASAQLTKRQLSL